MAFQVIRCGDNCCLVIAVYPAGATPETLDAKFYRYANWQINDHDPNMFNEISRATALGYFSGHADGLGWHQRPDYEFESLAGIVDWIKGEISRNSEKSKQKGITMDEIFFSRLIEKVKPYFAETSGHGFDHVMRVYHNALMISANKSVDLDIVKAAVLLHDIARHKQDIGEVKCHAKAGAEMASLILAEMDFPSEKIPAVVYAIEVHRYSKGINPETLEAKILQDADRLDALGAICIARVFGYGAKKGRPMYDPNIQMSDKYDGTVSGTSFNHFHEKILKITPDTFKTEKARLAAESRYQFIIDFMSQFEAEYNGRL